MNVEARGTVGRVPTTSCRVGAVLACLVLAAVPLAAAGSGFAASPAPGPPPSPGQRFVQMVLPGPPGTSAEATAAIDPANPLRMAVAEDPYLTTTHIQASESVDGGQHWSAAIDVLPPGMAKSYDPQLAFLADGGLVVIGGASPDTQLDCQRHSEIFVASIRDGAVDYHAIATAGSTELLDRPTLVADPVRNQLIAGWTASSGPAAACLLRPQASRTWIARVSTGLALLGSEPLPPATQAPFGSSMAVSGSGAIGLVVAGEARGDGLDIVAYRSTDAIHWTATHLGRGRTQPDSLPGLEGPLLSMPTITGLPSGFAVAWTDASTGIERTRLAADYGSGWQSVTPPGTPDSLASVLPTVVARGDHLILVQATGRSTGLTFETWQRVQGVWFRTAADDAGNIADRRELGEALGLAVTATGATLTAVPVDTAGHAALLVRSARPPVPRPAPTTAHPRGTIGRSRSGDTLPAWLPLALGGLVLIGVGGAVLRRRR